MKASPCKKILRYCFFILLTAMMTGVGGYCRAETVSPEKKTEKIQISAQNLEADDAKKYAEFSGNVRVVQGETVITSDRLKIYYEGNPTQTGKGPKTSGDAIQKIVASGNVKIRFDNMDAQAAEAVYTTADRIMILNGPGAQIRKTDSGEISGDKIIIHRDDGRIRFEGGVQGFLMPGEKGLN